MRVDLEHGRGEQPLYVQLANALQDFITLEKLKPGDILPSETVLASDNRLSRATVIKAFDTLIDRGIVTRQQGKGTFVNARPMERQLPQLNSFSEHVHGLGLAPGSTLLTLERYDEGMPGRPTSQFEDDMPLVVIERLRTVGESAVGIHRTLVPADVADLIGLTEHAAARSDFSFYEALSKAGVHLNSGDESLRAINADARDSEILGVDEGVALIEIVRASRDTTGRLVEVVRARYLGTQYLYHITFAPTSPGGLHEETTSFGTRTGGGLAAASDRMFE
ncbi:GntR family transcriptional regulator [Glaciihabitans sp. UYNi722]|uniref:GntR family transcriptional regulator n=1 Tax=Glaciihabitans sp. UYNi722 TaxID=3156344 RepID=UPI00339697F4